MGTDSDRCGDERTSIVVSTVQTRRLTVAQFVDEAAARYLGVASSDVRDEDTLHVNDAHVIAYELEHAADFPSGSIEDNLPDDGITVGTIIRIGIALYEKMRPRPESFWHLPAGDKWLLPG